MSSVVFTEWAEIWVFPVSLKRSFTISMSTCRPLLVFWNCYYPHLSCFHTLWPRSEPQRREIGFGHGLKCHGSLYSWWKDRRKAVSISTYNSLATKYNAKISLWDSDGPSTTGTSFISWMLLRILTSHTSTHIQQPQLAGVHVWTVTAGRHECFNNHCGPSCMF